MRKGSQESAGSQEIIPGTDTLLSLACDDFIEIRDRWIKKVADAREDKESMQDANVRVAEMMIDMGRDTLRHGGLSFRVKKAKESRPVVVVKSE